MVWAYVTNTSGNPQKKEDVTFNVSGNAEGYASLEPYNPGMFWVVTAINTNKDLTCCSGSSCTTMNTTRDVLATHDGHGLLKFVIPPIQLIVGWG